MHNIRSHTLQESHHASRLSPFTESHGGCHVVFIFATSSLKRACDWEGRAWNSLQREHLGRGVGAIYDSYIWTHPPFESSFQATFSCWWCCRFGMYWMNCYWCVLVSLHQLCHSTVALPFCQSITGVQSKLPRSFAAGSCDMQGCVINWMCERAAWIKAAHSCMVY